MDREFTVQQTDALAVPVRTLRARPEGTTIQQAVVHWLTRADDGPHLTLTEAQLALGLNDRRQISHHLAAWVKATESARAKLADVKPRSRFRPR